MSSAPASSPVAVLTGGTSGLGRHVALGLVRAGRRLVLVARSTKRGEEARRWIARHARDAEVEVEAADLSSLAETRAAGERIAARHPQVSVLINNAGVFEPKPVRTSEGLERVLAVNLLAPAVLTRALLPALLAGAPARIVDVGSSASDRARVDPGRLELGARWNMMSAYGGSKLALLMWTTELARRLEGTGVTAVTVHPGFVATDLVREGGVIGAVWRLLGRFALTEEQGADTPLHAALDPAFAEVSGVFVKRRRPVDPNPAALDPAARLKLWAEVERLAGPWLAPLPADLTDEARG